MSVRRLSSLSMIGVYLRQKADYWKKLLVIDNQFGSGAQEKKHLWAKQLLSLFGMLLFSFLFFCNVVSNTSSLQTSTSEGCWPQWPQFITIGISRNKKRNHSFFCLVFKDWNDLTKVCNSFSKLVLVLFFYKENENRGCNICFIREDRYGTYDTKEGKNQKVLSSNYSATYLKNETKSASRGSRRWCYQCCGWWGCSSRRRSAFDVNSASPVAKYSSFISTFFSCRKLFSLGLCYYHQNELM